MEFLEGETLADRLTRGALPLDQALTCGGQVADALASAHRAGVIHGDLKPANIMLTRSGAKLFDFGVAKLRPDAAVAVAGHSFAVTQETPVTRQGVIVGTLQYMAPEQLEGRECDARADLFGFGAVLYEALTGRKAFDGQSQASVVAAIMEREPEPLSKLQPLAPPGLDRLVRKCLAKDRDDRWQTAKDLGDELRWLLQSVESRGPARSDDSESGLATKKPRRKRSPRRRFVFRLTIGISLSVLLAVLLVPRRSFRAPSVLPARENAPTVVTVLPAGPSIDSLPERGVGTVAPALAAGPVDSGMAGSEARTLAAAQAALYVETAIREGRFQEARGVIARLDRDATPDRGLRMVLLFQIGEAEVRSAVDAYAAAYSSRDRNAVLAVYPAISAQKLADVDKLRTRFKTYAMQITVKQISFIQLNDQLEGARVECATSEKAITLAGQDYSFLTNEEMMFERKGSSWVRVR